MDFENTQIAYQTKATNKLKKEISLYKMFNLFSNSGVIGQFVIKNTMPIVQRFMSNVLLKQFCGGQSIRDTEHLVKDYQARNITTLYNLNVESVQTESQAVQTTKIMHDLIEHAQNIDKPNESWVILRVTGVVPEELLAKVQSKAKLSTIEQRYWQDARKRIFKLSQFSEHRNTRLVFDAEFIRVQSTIHLDLAIPALQLLNSKFARIYTTIQFYRKDSHEQLHHAIELARKEKFILGLKMVRGAYLENEKVQGNREKIHATKQDTNYSYNTGLEICMQNIDVVSLIIASHNKETVRTAVKLMEKYNISPSDKRVQFAQMQGMRDDLTELLAYNGYNVLKFIPFGPKQELIPYLIRRGIENASAFSGAKEEVELRTKELELRLQAKRPFKEAS